MGTNPVTMGNAGAEGEGVKFSARYSIWVVSSKKLLVVMSMGSAGEAMKKPLPSLT